MLKSFSGSRRAINVKRWAFGRRIPSKTSDSVKRRNKEKKIGKSHLCDLERRLVALHVTSELSSSDGLALFNVKRV